MLNNKALLIVDKKLQPVAYNDELLSLLSLKSNQSIKREIVKLLRKNLKFRNVLAQYLHPAQLPTNFPAKIHLLDGNILDINLDIHPIYQNGNEQNLVISFENKLSNDLENINLERSLKYNVINKIAASIAHEIRNPLSSLAIHIEVLDNTVTNLSFHQNEKERIKKSIQILHSELERVIKIIDQFFSLARSNGNEMKYEDINTIILEVFELIKQQCYEQSIKLNIKLEKNLPFVHIYRNQVIQVILNIIINSIEAMPTGGELRLVTKQIDKKIHIIIEDTGCGMTDEQKKHIFDLFYSTKENSGGIGLTLSREIIEGQQGRIIVESNIEKGSTFTIILPKASQF